MTLVNDLDVAITLSDGTTLALGDDPAGNVNGSTLPVGTFPAGPATVTVRGARVPGQLGYPGSDAQAYALVVSGAITCAAPSPVADTLRVMAWGDDAVLGWDATPDAASYVVFDVDETARFASRTEVGAPAGPGFRQVGALRDGELRFWLVATRNECGDVSGD